MAVRHAVGPAALVHAAVGLRHSAVSLHFVSSELTLILGSVLPDKHAKAVLALVTSDCSPRSKF